MTNLRKIIYLLLMFIFIITLWFITYLFTTTEHCIVILSEKTVERTLVGGGKINVYLLEVYDGVNTFTVSCNDYVRGGLSDNYHKVSINNNKIIKVEGVCK